MEDFNGMEQADRPKMVVLAGPNGSGKSTVTRGLRESEAFPENYINADDIAVTLRQPDNDPESRQRKAAIIEPNMPDLPWYAQIAKLEKRLTEDEIAGYLEAGVQRTDLRNAFAAILADDQRKESVRGGEDFAFETVMSTQGKLAMFDEARSKGYQVEMVFVTTESAEINKQRVLNRVQEGGHNVDPGKIVERYDRAMKMLPAALEMVDSADVFDNTFSKPILVARKRDGVVEFPEIELPPLSNKPSGHLGSIDLDTWFDKEEQAQQLKDVKDWVQTTIRGPIEARQQSLDQIHETFPHATRASIEHGSEVYGRILAINDVHVLQHDRENNGYVVHDRSTLSPSVVEKLQDAMENAKDVTIAYNYGSDSKLVDQSKTLDKTIMGQQELDQYMFDPGSREEPKPKHM